MARAYTHQALPLLLLKLAARSPHRRSRHSSVLLSKHGEILSTGWNYGDTHSEEHVIRRRGYKIPPDSILWNIMIKRKGAIGNSRPCEDCQRLLAAFGIKHVVYSTEVGFVKEFLNV